MRRRTASFLVAVLCLVGCTPEPGPAAVDTAVVVASFDFPESVLLAEVYAQALEGARVPVRRELGLGPRELVLPALRQGLVDVVPEYLGSALAGLGADPSARPVPQVRAQLAALLAPDGLRVLTPSAAQDQNALAVTRATAERWQLRRTSDLRPHAADLTLTGPPECPARPHCLPGWASVYGLRFGDFLPYERESQRVAATEQGLADVAVVFTTDGLVAEADLVLLEDDRDLQPAENVVPVVSRRALARHGDRVVRVLDAVSAALTTSALLVLSWRVQVGRGDVVDEARGWLLRRGLPVP